jgi:hypothetical protein
MGRWLLNALERAAEGKRGRQGGGPGARMPRVTGKVWGLAPTLSRPTAARPRRVGDALCFEQEGAASGH